MKLTLLNVQVHRRQQTQLQSGPFDLDILKGYIVVSSNLGIAVYNTTMSMRSGPRETLLESYSEISSLFGREVWFFKRDTKMFTCN